jgi:hypothetical protein
MAGLYPTLAGLMTDECGKIGLEQRRSLGILRAGWWLTAMGITRVVSANPYC